MATSTKTARKHRITKEEALEREEHIYDLLASRPTPATLSEIAFATGLTYATTSVILRKLVEDGMVAKVGRDGRRILFSINGVTESPQADQAPATTLTVVPDQIDGDQVVRHTETVSAAGYVGESPAVKPTVTPVLEVAPLGPAPNGVEELPSVAVNTVLRQIHLGRELSVIGFHLEEGDDRPLIDLRSRDGEIVTVSLMV